MIAKFPNSCCICKQKFIPGESEIELHPTKRGPQGGKQYMHVECDHGGQLPAPPDEIYVPGMANPFTNAGRRTRKGKQKAGRLPRMSAASTCDVGGMSKEELVSTVARGKPADKAAATSELERRGRNAEGTKLAWLQPKKGKTKKAANNPFGRGYGYGYEF